MNEKKKRLLRIFFAGEIVLFIILYCVGPRGVYSLHHIKKENRDLANEVATLQQEIAQLDEQIRTVQSDPFYKEKIAREQLQMARKGETIYLIDA